MDGYLRYTSTFCAISWALFCLLMVVGVPDAQGETQSLVHQSPQQSGQSQRSETNDKAVKSHGPCVLLTNQNVLYGSARQEGETIIVTESNDSEIRLPRSAVACWASSVEQLYRYRVDHRQGNNATVHLDDAEWCLQNNLLELARTELSEAYDLDPNHPRLRRLVERLDRQQKPVRDVAPQVLSVELSPKKSESDGILPINHEEESPRFVHSVRSLELFTRSVQFTLLNKCGRCHHQASSDRQWRLHMPIGRSRPSAQTSMRNLTATLPFVDVNDPEKSDLVAKATLPHAGQMPILDRRHHKAISNLKLWLQLAADDLRAADTATTQMADSHLNAVDERSISAEPSHPLTASVWSADNRLPFSGSKQRRSNDVPTRMPSVDNPFDPEIFNRQFHRESSSP